MKDAVNYRFMKALRQLAFLRRKSAAPETATTSASTNGSTSANTANPIQAASSTARATGELPASASTETRLVSIAPHSEIAHFDAPSDVIPAPENGVSASGATLPPLSGVRSLPRPALRWVGTAHRIALRELDFAADADIVCSWQRETYNLNFADFRFTDSFAAAFRHDLRRAALDPNHGLFVLDDGAPIGFLWLVICENTWTGERYGYINNLYLTPAQRAHGLGGELMEQSETWFKSRRIKRVRLTVTIANEAACRLYQSRGYEVTRWEMEKNL